MHHPLKQAIKSQGRTITYVADCLKYPYHSLVTGLNGHYKLSGERIREICQLLGISPEPYINPDAESNPNG